LEAANSWKRKPRKNKRRTPTRPLSISSDRAACALAPVAATPAYVRGAKAGTARSKAGTFEIVEVLVVGVETCSGLKQASPAVYFTQFKVKERPA
jgi:hypothetical protein